MSTSPLPVLKWVTCLQHTNVSLGRWCRNSCSKCTLYCWGGFAVAIGSLRWGLETVEECGPESARTHAWQCHGRIMSHRSPFRAVSHQFPPVMYSTHRPAVYSSWYRHWKMMSFSSVSKRTEGSKGRFSSHANMRFSIQVQVESKLDPVCGEMTPSSGSMWWWKGSPSLPRQPWNGMTTVRKDTDRKEKRSIHLKRDKKDFNNSSSAFFLSP